MKLAFIFDTRFIKYDGDYYCTNLSIELLSRRYLTVFDEMVIVGRCKEVSESPVGKYVKANNEKITFNCIPDEIPINRIINFKKNSKHIESIINECDAIICRGWRGSFISKKMEKNYLIEVVNCAWDSYWNHGILGKVVAPIIYLLRRCSTYSAPYVLYVTQKFLQKRYPTKGRSAAISDVRLDEFDDVVLANRIKKIESMGKNSIIHIGTAGAVNVPFKGQRFVIGALALLKERGMTNYIYELAGSGDNTKVKQYAEKKGVIDQIIFKGSIMHDNMNEWYDGLDLYIQPSLQEGLPRAVVEAMSRALPCYGANTGGIPELLEKDCVCNNNHNLERKFADLISAYNQKDAIKYAIRNYEEAKKYRSSVLDQDLFCFLKTFAGETERKENA